MNLHEQRNPYACCARTGTPVREKSMIYPIKDAGATIGVCAASLLGTGPLDDKQKG